MKKRLLLIAQIVLIAVLLSPACYLFYLLLTLGVGTVWRAHSPAIAAALCGALLALITWLLCRTARAQSALARERSYYDALLNSTHSLSVYWNTNRTFARFNPYMLKNVDASKLPLDISLIQKLFGSTEAPSNYTTGEELYRNALDPKGRRLMYTDQNGNEHHVIFNSVELKSPDAGDHHILSVSTDITEIIHLRQELIDINYNLALSEERYNLAMEAAEIGIIVNDIGESNGLYFSDNARKILGFPPNQAVTNADFRARIHPDDYNNYVFEINQLLIGLTSSFMLELRLRIHTGDYHYFMMKYKNTINQNGDVIRATGAFIDIHTQKEINELIDRSTFADELTGLPNRRSFMVNGESLLEKAECCGRDCALIYFDIDRFKRVNNLSGYDAGDQLLKSVASAVKPILSDDAFFARLGADDFGVIAPVGSKEEAESLCESIGYAVSGIRQSVAMKEHVTVSIGASLGKTEKENIVTMLEKCNMALTVAKTGTIGSVQFYDDSVRQLILEREILEEELREAYISGQLTLYYQPKINLKTRRLAGVEALMRWNHPTKGIIPPGKFIPVAEEIGLITKLDEWGLQEACRQNKQWQDMGFPPIKMSVNVSQAQLYQTDLVATIKNALAETGLEARWLEIELTETMAMKDIQKTIEILNRIRALGCHISMDDFGTGYSSLSSLKLIPIDILKIDRSLVFDVETSDTSRYITAAIINLASSMKLSILAEGIETQGQLEFLSDLGCDLAQGFYFGRPYPPNEFVEYFERFTGSVMA